MMKVFGITPDSLSKYCLTYRVPLGALFFKSVLNSLITSAAALKKCNCKKVSETKIQ